MTTTVQEFIKDKSPVEKVTLDHSIIDVVKLMIGNDYSQLPVIDTDNCPVGLVTSESILSTLNNFGANLRGVRIKHTMVKKPQTFDYNIDLLDLFEDMTGSVALVVDDEGKLVQIITDYDTAEYFRQRAEDILLVENIENMLKDFVQQAFSSQPDGEVLLAQSVQSLTGYNSDLQGKVKGAFQHYTNKENQPFNPDLFDEVFDRHLAEDNTTQSSFDDLSLGNYIALFLYNAHWAHYEEIFHLSKQSMNNLLESVRQTRNDLSHFREITADQSHQLRDCYDLLIDHQDVINLAFASSSSDTDSEEFIESTKSPLSTQDKELILPVEDEPAPNDSRYAPLAIWLQEQPPEKDVVKPRFSQIEEIIEGKLPASAYKNRAWWANDSVGHVQSKQWLDVGWRISSVNMTKEIARFARIKERQKAYIDFYSVLVNSLSEQPEFSTINKLPAGNSWHFIRSTSKYSRIAFNYAFGRGSAFRVELYIDIEDQQKNKQIFDALHDQKDLIESEIGHDLLWQRLDNRRASRIAHVLKGHITDSDEDLAQLQQQAVPTMVNLVNVLESRVEAVAQKIA